LLEKWEGRKLYSIDPWFEFPPDQYVDISNLAQSHQDGFYEETVNRLKKFGDRSVILREKSEDAIHKFQDGQLDFAYIDAQHSYEAVARDIRLWWPKVKRKGILCGHDYINDGEYPFGTFGVKKAVNEFISRRKLEFFISTEAFSPGKVNAPSWFLLKSS
jgi:hypothetical protein